MTVESLSIVVKGQAEHGESCQNLNVIFYIVEFSSLPLILSFIVACRHWGELLVAETLQWRVIPLHLVAEALGRPFARRPPIWPAL